MKTIICPNCGEEQDNVVIWQQEENGYFWNVVSESYTGEKVDDAISGEITTIVCDSCGEEFPDSIQSKIKKLL